MNVELHFGATILLTSLTLTLLKRIFVSKFLEQCPNLITFQLSYSKFFENKSLWEGHLRFVGFRYTITHLKTELDYFHSLDQSKSSSEHHKNNRNTALKSMNMHIGIGTFLRILDL